MMRGKGLPAAMSGLLVLFYIAIILFVAFGVMRLNLLANFGVAITFETIGIALLVYFVFGNAIFRPLKVGYFVPLLIATIVYTIVLDAVNLACISMLSQEVFLLVNLVTLFVYCLVSVPMYVLGRK